MRRYDNKYKGTNSEISIFQYCCRKRIKLFIILLVLFLCCLALAKGGTKKDVKIFLNPNVTITVRMFETQRWTSPSVACQM
jgi:hypothetical protein